MKTVLRSIWALAAGFAVGTILSIAMDILFNSLGLMSMENFKQTPLLIVTIIIIYRFVFNVVGSYWAARLAPNNPMKHVIFMGVIGTLFALSGAMFMWEKAIPFYNIAIILISFPSAWIGGQLFIKNQSNGKTKN